MRIWTCWQTRRRIPPWIRGACPSSEAAAVARHVARCPACANEVALELALGAVAGADGPGREPAHGQATWTRLAQAIATEGRAQARRSRRSRSRLSALGSRLRTKECRPFPAEPRAESREPRAAGGASQPESREP